MIQHRHSLATSPSWAPAFAGVEMPHSKRSYWPLFSREGGSPVWVPAFAGKQFCGAQTAIAPC